MFVLILNWCEIRNSFLQESHFAPTSEPPNCFRPVYPCVSSFARGRTLRIDDPKKNLPSRRLMPRDLHFRRRVYFFVLPSKSKSHNRVSSSGIRRKVRVRQLRNAFDLERLDLDMLPM